MPRLVLGRFPALAGVAVVVAWLLVAAAAPAAAQSPDAPDSTQPPAEEQDAPEGGGGLFPFWDPAGVVGEVTAELASRIAGAVNDWFRSLVADGLGPALDLLSRTLLATPEVLHDQKGRVENLWWTSNVLADTAYGLLITIGGVIVMTHETLQSRYALKDIAPRLFFGFAASNLSFWLTGQTVEVANGLSSAFLNQGYDRDWVVRMLEFYLLGPLDFGVVILVIMAGFVLLMVLALIATSLMRLALTILLIVAAPLALACHALPQTEGVARFWWRAFLGVLGIQVLQALTLVTVLRVFLTPGPPSGFFAFGNIDWIGIIAMGCLFWILLAIPFWVIRAVFHPRGSPLVRMARAYVVYRGLRWLDGGTPRSGTRRQSSRRRSGGSSRPRPAPGGPGRPSPPGGPGPSPPGGSGTPRPRPPGPGGAGPGPGWVPTPRPNLPAGRLASSPPAKPPGGWVPTPRPNRPARPASLPPPGRSGANGGRPTPPSSPRPNHPAAPAAPKPSGGTSPARRRPAGVASPPARQTPPRPPSGSASSPARRQGGGSGTPPQTSPTPATRATPTGSRRPVTGTPATATRRPSSTTPVPAPTPAMVRQARQLVIREQVGSAAMLRSRLRLDHPGQAQLLIDELARRGVVGPPKDGFGRGDRDVLMTPEQFRARRQR